MSLHEIQTVAVLATWLDGWYQSALWRAAVFSAKRNGCRVLALVNYASPGKEAQSGVEGIWGIATRSDCVGAILSSGPLSYWEGESVLQKIRDWIAPKSTVSVGLKVPNVDSVVPGEPCISEVVSHLVRVHGCQKIVWIAGPANNSDAKIRMQSFMSGIVENGLAFDESLVEDGGFILEGGYAAMQRLLERHPDLDAVIAANDAMAIGAMKALHDFGIDIPDKVKVAGFDDTLESRLQSPPLSTVNNPVEEMVDSAIHLCLERARVPARPKLLKEETLRPIYRSSCGCLARTEDLENLGSTPEAIALLTELSVRMQLERSRFVAWFRKTLNAAALPELDFWELALVNYASESETKEKFLLASRMVGDRRKSLYMAKWLDTETLVRNIHRISSALSANPDPERMIANLGESLRSWYKGGFRLFLFDKEFSPTGTEVSFASCKFGIRLAWDGMHFESISEIEDLLPETGSAGDAWIAMPLEHGNMRFGLLLLQGWLDKEGFLELIRVVLSASFADSWRARSENALQDRLRQMTARDAHTRLWNRMGFLETGNQVAAQAFREKHLMGVLLLELEDYSENQKTYGKEDTLLAVKIIADSFRECFRTSDVLARLDDSIFVALFVLRESTDHMRLLSRVQKIILEQAENKMLPWRISIRVGWTIWDGMDGSSLKSQIEIALGRARGQIS